MSAAGHARDISYLYFTEMTVRRGSIQRPRKPGQGKGRKASRFSALRGTRKTGISTDEIMNLLRGYDKDAGDPGFKVAKK